MTIDKDHVLDEIRRTAKANGGKPLGHRKFATETGIGRNDWHGKHWARWSEAVQEAGLESNTFEDAYDEEYLVKWLLDLTRELAHVPVQGDLRMKARSDLPLPSDRPFWRMGPKGGWNAKILALTQRHATYADLVPLLGKDAEQWAKAIADDSDGQSESWRSNCPNEPTLYTSSKQPTLPASKPIGIIVSRTDASTASGSSCAPETCEISNGASSCEPQRVLCGATDPERQWI